MLAPESARALQALMAVQTVSGDTEEALRTGSSRPLKNSPLIFGFVIHSNCGPGVICDARTG